MVGKSEIQATVIQLFSQHFHILAGAFIGSRSALLDNPSPDSDFDCFLIVDGSKGHGSEVWIDNTPVHVVLIPRESVEKYLQFEMVRCSWQFLTVLDWLRRGEIFYDPDGLLNQYAQKATAWFDDNIKNFISAKVSEIRIQLKKFPSGSGTQSTDEDLSNRFAALYTAIEAILTLLLFKGKVFHGPKHLISDLRLMSPTLYRSFLSAICLEFIDTQRVCNLVEAILSDIESENIISKRYRDGAYICNSSRP